MTDREKVIKGLEICIKEEVSGPAICGMCPYYGVDCLSRLHADALRALNGWKEQKDD